MTTSITSPAKLLPVLVATREKQGQRRNDFCWCDEDEPVRFATECDGERVDGRCGCRRCMTGMTTLKGTTTVCVKHLPITSEQFASLLKSSFEKSGFPLDDEDVTREANQLLRLARTFPVDMVIEKRGDHLQSRA